MKANHNFIYDMEKLHGSWENYLEYKKKDKIIEKLTLQEGQNIELRIDEKQSLNLIVTKKGIKVIADMLNGSLSIIPETGNSFTIVVPPLACTHPITVGYSSELLRCTSCGALIRY